MTHDAPIIGVAIGNCNEVNVTPAAQVMLISCYAQESAEN